MIEDIDRAYDQALRRIFVFHILRMQDGVTIASCNIAFNLIHNKKHTGRNKTVDILQQTCYQQADIGRRSHGLRQLVDDKSVARCQLVLLVFVVVVNSKNLNC